MAVKLMKCFETFSSIENLETKVIQVMEEQEENVPPNEQQQPINNPKKTISESKLDGKSPDCEEGEGLLGYRFMDMEFFIFSFLDKL